MTSELTITDDQTGFSEAQLAALAHIGVEEASGGDLQVFFHVAKRTGLDPFARQIHMIGRRNRQPDGSYRMKYTIQTGIDGFRLVGRRAANASKHGVSVGAPQWAHEDGSWRDVWTSSWGYPIAARVTITRDGDAFTAVCLFDEYKQTKRDSTLTSMWESRPAGQLAKCAEAAAWRMSFPQDLGGMYVEGEISPEDERHGAPANAAAALEADLVDVTDVEVVEDDKPAPEPLDTSSKLAKAMFAAIGKAGITEAERLPWISSVIGHEISTSREMSTDDARLVIAKLEEVNA